jgi:hypothetical protein
VRGERCLVTLATGQHVAVAATVQPKPNPRPSRNLGREEFGELDLLLQSPRRGSRVAPNCLYCYDCPAQTPRNAENAGLPDDVSAIALATVEVSGVSNGGRSRETLKDERLGCASATP